MARLEAKASGADPDIAATRAARRYLSEEQANHRRFCPASSLGLSTDPESRLNTLEWVPEASRVVGIRPARRRTAGQRKRFLRNQAILVLRLAGFSQRQVSELFDLPHSNIKTITDEMRALVI